MTTKWQLLSQPAELRLRDPGIAALIGCEEDMELIGEASNGREAVAIAAIRGEFLEARIIVLTTHPGAFQVSRVLKAGARAYLFKGTLRKELLETIRAAHAGQRRLSSEVAAEIAEHASEYALTPREIDVLRLIAPAMRTRRLAPGYR